MSKTKFIDIPTIDDFITVNVANIAMLTKDGDGAIVTLDITDDDGKFIKIESIQTYNKLSSEISI